MSAARMWCCCCGKEVEVPHCCPQAIRGEATEPVFALVKEAVRAKGGAVMRFSGRRSLKHQGAP